MKLEELIKKVIKLNKLNKELYINKKYVVVLQNRYKTIEFDKLYFGELERFWIDTIAERLIQKNFERFNCNDSWYLEIIYENETLYFDLFIKEIQN